MVPIHIGVLVVCLEGLLMGFTRVHITPCPPPPWVWVFEYMHVSALFLFRYVSERVSVVVFCMIVCMYINCVRKKAKQNEQQQQKRKYIVRRALAQKVCQGFFDVALSFLIHFFAATGSATAYWKTYVRSYSIS